MATRRASADTDLFNEFVSALYLCLTRHQDQRICQVIVNATNRDDPFYVEDEGLVQALFNYAKGDE